MSTLKTPLIILAWYASNICVLLLNKYLLGVYGFRFPVFLTLCHMIACASMAYAASLCNIFELQLPKSRKQLGKVVLLATVFCASLVMGNASLRFLPVSFTQVIGATTPLFTACLSLAMLRERETTLVYSSLLPVVMGIALATGAEPSFHLIGFAAAVGATALRAFKSVLQGILLTDGEKLNSMSLLAIMSSLAIALLIPTTALLEPSAPATAVSLVFQQRWFLPTLALNSFLAFGVNLTNFLVTKYTSALTLQVLGNAKGVVAALISIAIFRNPVSSMGAVGYCITMVGIVAYSQARKASKADAPLSGSSSLHSSPDSNQLADVESLVPVVSHRLDFADAVKAKDTDSLALPKLHSDVRLPHAPARWSPQHIMMNLQENTSSDSKLESYLPAKPTYRTHMLETADSCSSIPHTG